jgi:hypothetical protein
MPRQRSKRKADQAAPAAIETEKRARVSKKNSAEEIPEATSDDVPRPHNRKQGQKSVKPSAVAKEKKPSQSMEESEPSEQEIESPIHVYPSGTKHKITPRRGGKWSSKRGSHQRSTSQVPSRDERSQYLKDLEERFPKEKMHEVSYNNGLYDVANKGGPCDWNQKPNPYMFDTVYPAPKFRFCLEESTETYLSAGEDPGDLSDTPGDNKTRVSPVDDKYQ